MFLVYQITLLLVKIFYSPFSPKLRHYFKLFFRQSFLKEMAETDIDLLKIKHYKNTS